MAYKNIKYRLTIQMYDLIEDSNGNSSLSSFPTEPPVVITNPITISFNVNSTPYNGMSNATIDIFNLNETTRHTIFYDYRRLDRIPTVYLEAGYEDGKFDLIFSGHAQIIISQRQGVDMVTHIEAISGALVADSSISATLKDGVSEEEVNDLIMKSGLGIAKSTKMTFRNYVFIRPVALFGNRLRLLKEYTQGRGIIDLDRFYVLDDNEVIGEKAKIINDESGLISTPRRTQTTVYFNVMFAPEIHPADLVSLSSRVEPAFDGLYKVLSVKHNGTISDGTATKVTTQVELIVGAQALGTYRYDK